MTHTSNNRTKAIISTLIVSAVFMLAHSASARIANTSQTSLPDSTAALQSSVGIFAGLAPAPPPPPATPVSGSYKKLVNELEQFVGMWEKQKAKRNNPPQENNCDDLRAWLQQARDQIAAERAQLAEAQQHPPQKENANRGIVAGWARYLNDWRRDLDNAAKRLDDLQNRIDILCP